MSREKIESKIKDLNSMRAIQKKYLKENEKRHDNNEISDAIYNKHKNKIELKLEKIRKQILKLEDEARQIGHDQK